MDHHETGVDAVACRVATEGKPPRRCSPEWFGKLQITRLTKSSAERDSPLGQLVQPEHQVRFGRAEVAGRRFNRCNPTAVLNSEEPTIFPLHASSTPAPPRPEGAPDVG